MVVPGACFSTVLLTDKTFSICRTFVSTPHLLLSFLLIAGCDLATTPSVQEDQVADSEIDLQWAADDYYQALKTLDSLRHDMGQSASTEKANSAASVLARYAVTHGENPDDVREHVHDLQDSGSPRSPKQAISGALKEFPGAQRAFLKNMLDDLRKEQDLASIHETVDQWTAKAEQKLSGNDLLIIKQVATFIAGTARHWTEIRGQSFRTRTIGAKSMHTGCEEVPAEENYFNYWAQLSGGLNSFAQGCAVVGGAGFYYGGPQGAGVGCAIGGFPPGIAGFYAEREDQQDQYHQAVRAWCDDCGSTSQNAAMFCLDELSE